jgi:hypothetical protein
VPGRCLSSIFRRRRLRPLRVSVRVAALNCHTSLGEDSGSRRCLAGDAIAPIIPLSAYLGGGTAILLGLGYFNDVDPDDALPVPRSEIVAYWTRRQPEIIAARGQLGPS